MSLQVAAMTGPGGLPSSPSPGPDLNLNHPAQSIWPDHMNADRQADNAVTRPQDTITRERTSSSSQSNQNTSHQDRKAVSNLLEALNKTTKTVNVSPDQNSGLPYPEATIPTSNNEMNVQDHSAPSDNDNGNAPTNGAGFANNPIPLNSSFDVLPFPDLPPYISDQNMGLATTGLLYPDLDQPQQIIQDKREVEAFAKIEFEDGNYYITTWQCELGRDAMAYKDAIERAEEANNNQSSSGRMSRPSLRPRHQEDSQQLQGSAISEAGGFGGIDEAPISGHPISSGNAHPSNSSQLSASDVVRPQEVHYHPPAVPPFDYHRHAELHARALVPDWQQPAPVTDDHMPDADRCPIIPIHSVWTPDQDEVQQHKLISRRHVRFEWDFENECFKLKVLGTNGAFVDDEWLKKGASKNLFNGSKIQVSSVYMTFRLPRQMTEPLSDESGDDLEDDAMIRGSTSQTSNDAFETLDGPSRTKIKLFNRPGAPAPPQPLLNPDGQPFVRKRGPGRPPKDGIMSTRQRKELEKAAKLAEAKAANGGRTPPPMARNKPLNPPSKEELAKAELKPEKRKYNKRKRDGEDGEVLPSIEGGEEDIDSNEDKPPNKKPRASKSPSPAYPPYGSLTEEQLQRPTEPYARVIYELLLGHPSKGTASQGNLSYDQDEIPLLCLSR